MSTTLYLANLAVKAWERPQGQAKGQTESQIWINFRKNSKGIFAILKFIKIIDSDRPPATQVALH